jgi:hypothetical protein
MSFATNEDLTDYMPDALDHGVADWTSELDQATSDVQRDIKIGWFNLQFGQGRSLYGAQIGNTWDPTRLTASQWTKCTVYKAMYEYILPKLSTFRPEGDSFRERIDFYRKMYAEELSAEIAAGVQYDLDDSGTVTEGETWAVQQNRLFR